VLRGLSSSAGKRKKGRRKSGNYIRRERPEGSYLSNYVNQRVGGGTEHLTGKRVTASSLPRKDRAKPRGAQTGRKGQQRKPYL